MQLRAFENVSVHCDKALDEDKYFSLQMIPPLIIYNVCAQHGASIFRMGIYFYYPAGASPVCAQHRCALVRCKVVRSDP